MGEIKDHLHAVLLGIIEGLTEFLPVSSTAHLRIAQEWLGQDLESGYWKMFSIVIQLGAILAVVVYFRSRIRTFLTGFRWGRGRAFWTQPLVMVGLSFVITAIPCFLIDKWISERLESTVAIGIALIVGGIAMWWIDTWFSKRATTHGMERMTLRQAVAVGVFQILAAAFPGTSRSMATIAGGQIMGLDRTTALEFSFFLSIPVMVAASGFKLLQFLREGETGMDLHQGLVLAEGFVVSFVVAWGVIAWFMSWVKKRGFGPFAIYRVLLGVFVVGLWYWGRK